MRRTQIQTRTKAIDQQRFDLTAEPAAYSGTRERTCRFQNFPQTVSDMEKPRVQYRQRDAPDNYPVQQQYERNYMLPKQQSLIESPAVQVTSPPRTQNISAEGHKTRPFVKPQAGATQPAARGRVLVSPNRQSRSPQRARVLPRQCAPTPTTINDLQEPFQEPTTLLATVPLLPLTLIRRMQNIPTGDTPAEVKQRSRGPVVCRKSSPFTEMNMAKYYKRYEALRTRWNQQCSLTSNMLLS